VPLVFNETIRQLLIKQCFKRTVINYSNIIIKTINFTNYHLTPTNDAMETMSKKLRRLREERKLSQKQVSEHISVPVSTYRDWEYGREISGEPYTKLAEIFGVGLHEILGLESSKNSQDLLESIKSLKQAINQVEKAIQPFI
jgi:transcriptional regulator with XRE-family HTH domain